MIPFNGPDNIAESPVVEGENRIKIVPKYNYYLKEYENLYESLADTTDTINFFQDIYKAEEKSIPNYYYLISLLADANAFDLSNNFNLTAKSISGVLKDLALDQTNDSVLFKDLIIAERGVRERNSVVVVTPSFYKDLSEQIESQKTQHPFYNEINIPVQKSGTVIRDLLKQNGLYDQLQFKAGVTIKILNQAKKNGLNIENISTDYDMFYYVFNAPNEPGSIPIDAKQSGFTQQNTGIPYRNPYKDTLNSVLSKGMTPKLLEFDIPSPLIEGQDMNFKVGSATSTYLPLKNVSSFGNDGYQINTENGQTNALGFNLNFTKPSDVISNVNSVSTPLTFYSKALDCGDSPYGGKQITTSQILNIICESAKLAAYYVFDNVQNYSEILFFEVQKIDESNNEVIQTFILPNDPDVGDVITYIDSQIKYGKGYIYTIYAHTISIGNRLRRGNPIGEPVPGDPVLLDPDFQPGQVPIFYDNLNVKFQYENNYDVKLIRVPYYNADELLHPIKQKRKTFNIDSPPIPPNVLFYPFKNISNKLGFWFNIGIGELRMRPETLLNTGLQNEEVKKYYFIMQEMFSDITIGSPLLYKTDDFGGKIEVYRTTTRPETYADFRGTKIADIDVLGSRSLIDDITPNQDYYYTFRHVDVHDLPSNPTPVYHLKMITSNSGQETDSVRVGIDGLNPVLFSEILPMVDNYTGKKVEKSFKKYLLIEPSLAQTYLSFDNFENGDPISGFSTARDIVLAPQDLKIGKGDEDFQPVDGKKFKIRVTSKQTGRKIDLNVDFKNLSIIENYEE